MIGSITTTADLLSVFSDGWASGLYAIELIDSGRVKIGRSSVIPRRVREIESAFGTTGRIWISPLHTNHRETEFIWKARLMPRSWSAPLRSELTVFSLQSVVAHAEALPFCESRDAIARARILLGRFLIRDFANLGPVAADLHRLLKMKATADGKSLKTFLEENLGPLVEWQPEDKAQLKLAGVEV